MKHFALSIAVIAFAFCATKSRSSEPVERELRNTANPSKVVATELAFARSAREEGQWTAFRKFAADDAILLRPEGVIGLREWLADADDPPVAGNWQPHSVWSSCDGSLAVTRGAYDDISGKTGRFATVWERQLNGEYRFKFTFGSALDAPMAVTRTIAATVADCDSRFEYAGEVASTQVENGDGSSQDGTLFWRYALHVDGTRTFNVSIMQAGRLVDVLSDKNGPSDTDPE